MSTNKMGAGGSFTGKTMGSAIALFLFFLVLIAGLFFLGCCISLYTWKNFLGMQSSDIRKMIINFQIGPFLMVLVTLRMVLITYSELVKFLFKKLAQEASDILVIAMKAYFLPEDKGAVDDDIPKDPVRQTRTRIIPAPRNKPQKDSKPGNGKFPSSLEQ